MVGDATIGALDLFSDRPNPFDIEAAGQTAVLASFATMAINTFARGEDAAGLRRGLRGNRGIGAALHRVSEQEAVDMMKRYANHVNVELSDAAAIVIEHHGQLPRHA